MTAIQLVNCISPISIARTVTQPYPTNTTGRVTNWSRRRGSRPAPILTIRLINYSLTINRIIIPWVKTRIGANVHSGTFIANELAKKWGSRTLIAVLIEKTITFVYCT